MKPVPNHIRSVILIAPGCGSGGMFVQPEKFVESHGGESRASSTFAFAT